MRKLDLHLERRFLSGRECTDVVVGAQRAIQDGRMKMKKGKTETGLVGRECWVAWLEGTEWLWLNDRLTRLMRSAYPESPRGHLEPIQYTVYAYRGWFDWHRDCGPFRQSAISDRVVSASVQLTDPGEYDGCELELDLGIKTKFTRARGAAIVYPSHVLHRVTPNTSGGMRRALVAWLRRD
jgi:PKHD-type hydroxylase